MSYDKKYRLRAIEYMCEGKSFRETASVFKVSVSALQKWKSQQKLTGSLEPKKRRETWRKLEPSALKEYVEQHPDAYLSEIGDEFGCSSVAVFKALRRLNITRKKNDIIQGS